MIYVLRVALPDRPGEIKIFHRGSKDENRDAAERYWTAMRESYPEARLELFDQLGGPPIRSSSPRRSGARRRA